MQLYFFGASDKPLFGVHHPSQGRSRRKECIVLCPPIGTELLRSYRAFRQLATMLSKQGYDVLRFDYYGTGDSSGECEEGTIVQWRQDICTAIDEIKDVSGVEKVSLVGLRLGATLAAEVARENDVSRLVLWEPVIDGIHYLQDRIQTNLNYESEVDHESVLNQCLADNRPVGIMGFAWSSTLREEIAQLTVNEFSGIKTDRTFLLVRQHNDSIEGLKNVLAKNPGKFGYEQIDHPGEWGEFDALGSLLLPQATIQAVVACLL